MDVYICPHLLSFIYSICTAFYMYLNTVERKKETERGGGRKEGGAGERERGKEGRKKEGRKEGRKEK